MAPAPSDIADIFKSAHQSFRFFIIVLTSSFPVLRFRYGFEGAELRCLASPGTAFHRRPRAVSSLRPQREVLLREGKIPASVPLSRTGIKSRRPRSSDVRRCIAGGATVPGEPAIIGRH